MALISMIDEINVAVDCSDRQCSMIVNLKTMISDTGSICDAVNFGQLFLIKGIEFIHCSFVHVS